MLNVLVSFPDYLSVKEQLNLKNYFYKFVEAECLIELIDVICPKVNENFKFRYTMHESTKCQINNCNSALANVV